MRQIVEVLRLKAAGLSVREIAASAGVRRATVHEYLTRAAAAGLSWPLPVAVGGTALEAQLFPPSPRGRGASRPVPDWRTVHGEMKSRRHVTLQLLWLEWRASHPDGWAYSQFCLHHRAWLGHQAMVMRLEYAAGDRAFVDYVGDRMTIVEAATRAERPVEIFVGVLGCSGLLYVEASRGQDLESWLLAHRRMYTAWGGVPRVTIPNNLKAGVPTACRYEPEVNRSYQQLAQHFGTVIVPARAGHPRDKAAVEAGVLVVERWVLAPLRHRRFFSLGELNQAIQLQTAAVNARPFRGQPTSRQELFVDLERAALQPLPATPDAFTTIKVATGNPSGSSSGETAG